MNEHHDINPVVNKKSCHARHRQGCGKGLKIFLLGASLGAVYGMLFTKTAGKELREKLKKSKTPVIDLLEAGAEMDMEFIALIHKKVKKYLDS